MKHLKTQNSAPVYERWLDFMQFRNLLILNFVTFMLLLGMIGTHDYRSYHKTQLFLLVLNLVFAVFLCLKKGIFVHQNQLYEGLFLFGFPLESARVITSALPYLLPVQGTLSTHYQYTATGIVTGNPTLTSHKRASLCSLRMQTAPVLNCS